MVIHRGHVRSARDAGWAATVVRGAGGGSWVRAPGGEVSGGISADTVFAALPLNVGDRVSDDMLAQAARSLFRSGNFDDIKIARDGDVLVIIVAERPSISEITIDSASASISYWSSSSQASSSRATSMLW